MQVFNNPQIPATTPNFKAIKSVKCEGLYKKFPEESRKLVNAFKNNSKSMEFCKKYDVDVVFYAIKDEFESVCSSLHIFFKNPAKSRFLGFLGSQKDKIELYGYGNAYDTEKSLANSTKHLVDYMLESTPGKSVSGLLDQHLKIKENQIQECLDEKLAQKAKKEAKILQENKAAEQYNKDSENLNDIIKELIEESK